MYTECVPWSQIKVPVILVCFLQCTVFCHISEIHSLHLGLSCNVLLILFPHHAQYIVFILWIVSRVFVWVFMSCAICKICNIWGRFWWISALWLQMPWCLEHQGICNHYADSSSSLYIHIQCTMCFLETIRSLTRDLSQEGIVFLGNVHAIKSSLFYHCLFCVHGEPDLKEHLSNDTGRPFIANLQILYPKP